MRLARMIDGASDDLAMVESVVGSARHVLDVAQETERLGHRIVSVAKRVLVVAVIASVGACVGYGVKVFLDRQRAAAPERELTYFDDSGAVEPR